MTPTIQPQEESGAEALAGSARILVAGVGNIFLRDDGFGPEVVRQLAADPLGMPEGVRVVDYGIRGIHLAYDLLTAVDALILVDTVPATEARAGTHEDSSVPGSIRVMRVRAEDLDGTAAVDPHGMDPASMLEGVRALRGTLPVTFVVGCVAADTEEGIGLTPAVAAAVADAMVAVRELVSTDIRAGQASYVPSRQV